MAEEIKDFKQVSLPERESDFITELQARALISNSLTNFTEIARVKRGEWKSGNFVSGSTGWRMTAQGDLEANSGNFRGDITGASGTFSGTLSAANITGSTITGGSITIGSPTQFFVVTTSGVTAIRYEAATGNLVTNSQTAVSLGGSPASFISFDSAITDITRLSLIRNTSSSTTNTLAVLTDSGTTFNSAKLLALTSASTGIGLDISKTGDGTGVNLAQSGDGTGLQITQTGNGTAFRIDNDYTATTVVPFLIDDNNDGACAALFANNNGAHLRFAGDPTVSAPTDGDIWFDGSELKIRIGTTTFNIDKTAE